MSDSMLETHLNLSGRRPKQSGLLCCRCWEYTVFLKSSAPKVKLIRVFVVGIFSSRNWIQKHFEKLNLVKYFMQITQFNNRISGRLHNIYQKTPHHHTLIKCTYSTALDTLQHASKKVGWSEVLGWSTCNTGGWKGRERRYAFHINFLRVLGLSRFLCNALWYLCSDTIRCFVWNR